MTKYYSEPELEVRKYVIADSVFTDSTNDPNLYNNDDDDPPDDEGGNGTNSAGNWFSD